MKFATAKIDDESTFIGLLDEVRDSIIHLKKLFQFAKQDHSFPNDMMELIELGDSFVYQIRSLLNDVHVQECSYPLKKVTFLPPIPSPRKNVICVGKNYAEHVKEMGGDQLPEDIIIFTKAPTTIIAHDAAIPLHERITNQLDYEGELAVIIGKKGKGIKKEEALEYVFGYTILNDITARDLQSKHKQFFLGKSLDGSCPMGPYIIHHSAVSNPNHLHIETRINGEVRQSSNTKHFIFPIERIIEEISKGMTLEPGDIIATGTPAGVGKGFTPPKFLKDGDTIEIEIENLGRLRNTVKKM